METILKVGMEVYDQIFFGETPLKIIEVKGDMTLRVLRGEVTYCYTGDGRFIGDEIISNRHRGLSQMPTLSTSPYTLQGFEQKATIRTYEEAVEWVKKNSKNRVVYADEIYINEENEEAFENLKKLVILREYYNEGWKADWNNDRITKWTIEVSNNNLNVTTEITFSRPLYFKTELLAEKFLEEQRELLEKAKPLL